MPALYTKVRDACIAKKESESGKPATKQQIQNCKKMAAIHYWKQTGKPVPKDDSKANYETVYDISDYDTNERLKLSVDAMLEDNVITVIRSSESIIATFVNKNAVLDGELVFNAPFIKSETNYRLSEYKSDDPSKQGYTSFDDCYMCAHFVGQSGSLNGLMWGYCHLVKGVVGEYAVCDKFITNLVGLVETVELEDLDQLNEDTDDKLMMEGNEYVISESLKYYKVKIRNANSYKTFTITDFDNELGIKVFNGVKPDGSTEIQSVLFSKDPKHGWTGDKMKFWLESNKEVMNG
jgi:hypothetical protein